MHNFFSKSLAIMMACSQLKTQMMNSLESWHNCSYKSTMTHSVSHFSTCHAFWNASAITNAHAIWDGMWASNAVQILHRCGHTAPAISGEWRRTTYPTLVKHQDRARHNWWSWCTKTSLFNVQLIIQPQNKQQTTKSSPTWSQHCSYLHHLCTLHPELSRGLPSTPALITSTSSAYL